MSFKFTKKSLFYLKSNENLSFKSYYIYPKLKDLKLALNSILYELINHEAY
jgi:hypothetical protein